MDEKKQELLQWLNKLEKYAEEINLSSRILDRIKECKANLHKEEIEIDKIQCEIEEVFKSIEKKALPESANSDKKEKGVTLQEIREQIKKIVQRCHDDNEEVIDGTTDHKNTVLKKCDEQMKKIVQADKYMEELKQEALYVQFYEEIADEYKKGSISVISEMLGDMEQNYTHMIGHMKGMLQNTDSFKTGKINEKAFYELDVKREAVGEKLQAELEENNTGKNIILSFAKRTVSEIKKIVDSAELKKKVLAILPMVAAAIIFLINTLTKSLGSSAETETANNEFIAFLGEAVEIIKVLKKLFGSGGTSVMSIVAKVAPFIIVAVIYIIYLIVLKKKCNDEISKKSAAYLQTELIEFEQNGLLRQDLNNLIRNTAEEYEHQHAELFNHIFDFSDDETPNKKKDQLIELAEEWNKIK